MSFACQWLGGGVGFGAARTLAGSAGKKYLLDTSVTRCAVEGKQDIQREIKLLRLSVRISYPYHTFVHIR